MALATGCGILGPDDTRARVAWVEARFVGSDLQLRAVGSTGCGTLKYLGTHVDGADVVVYARATIANFECVAPNVYDATVSIPAPGSWAGIRILASQSGSPANAVEVFGIPFLHDRIDAFVGGRAVVEGVAENCPRIRLNPGRPTDIVYPIEFPREIEIRDGDGIDLSGVLPEAVTSFCYGGPLLRVQRVTLSLDRAS